VKQRAVAVERQVADIQLPPQLTRTRALDFDDLRAKVGQSQGARGAGEKLAEIEYDQAVER
jgi:hypothetical protein